MTTQIVPLAAVASQTLSIVLDGQTCAISVYTRSTGVYFDLYVNGAAVLRGMICRTDARLLLDRGYKGVVGDFVFVDTQGTDDPEYAGFGTRWLLLYRNDPPPVPVFL